jgi:glycosyltransferase involved in cell wall biosynthesis
MTKTLVIHFARFGPYHHARLKAAMQALQPIGWQVVGLETAGSDATYAWDAENRADFEPPLITAFPNRVHEEISRAECKQGLYPLLSKLQPDAMAIAGWGSNDALTSLGWCRQHGVKSIVMSESREVDGRRVWWKEWIKRLLIRRFDRALVGGKSHRDYLVKLGMSSDRIRLGYNVVDNAFFLGQSSSWRVKDHQLGVAINPYILASNRFVPRKNLIRLVQAFAAVTCTETLDDPGTSDLCLVGDGPERAALLSTCEALGLPVVDSAPWEVNSVVSSAATGPRVFLPGFRQIDELPRFYAHACCFVHPAISEPWGLVINEAMACSLPVLSSTNCGAAEELVCDGVNGYLFDPLNTAAITRCLKTFLNLSPEVRAEMGAASALTLERICPVDAFGTGLRELLSELSPA